MSTNKIKVTVDGIDVLVTPGSSVLQACELVGVEIPRFCFHERLLVAGNCRMCLVEIEKQIKPVASCAMPVMPGMNIFTDTPLVKKAREGVLEFLLMNHPLDCPICDQGGECDLQDQAMIFGSDKSRYRALKRGVEDKNFGPLIKTIMTRCIHCTRCVRFATEVAGVEVLGTTARGNDTEIGTYVEKMFNSELSGNIIDLCPVGALTSKPYAFTSRPWELKTTESIDVLDSMGSNIRVDARGTEIMRIIPQLNEEINEEWISDKTRFAYDALKRQRLTSPMIKNEDGKLVEVDWLSAFEYIKKRIKLLVRSPAYDSSAVFGSLTDLETMVMSRHLLRSLGTNPKLYSECGTSIKNKAFIELFTFNNSIEGIEDADLVLLIGTNPRKEAALINARLRKRFLRGNFTIANIGSNLDLTYPVKHLGLSPNVLKDIAEGYHPFCADLAKAQNPMIIFGEGLQKRSDYTTILRMLIDIQANLDKSVGLVENSILNLIQGSANQYGADLLGCDRFNPEEDIFTDLVYLFGVDEQTVNNVRSFNEKKFIIYQGHHGFDGLANVDVVLPSSAYTEKDSLFFNTEGRLQSTRLSLTAPGHAKIDWEIVYGLYSFLYDNETKKLAGKSVDELTFDKTVSYEDEVWKITSKINNRSDILALVGNEIPKTKTIGICENSRSLSSDLIGKNGFYNITPLKSNIENFYMTDVITKSSSTMAKCTELQVTGPQRFI